MKRRKTREREEIERKRRKRKKTIGLYSFFCLHSTVYRIQEQDLASVSSVHVTSEEGGQI